MAAKGSASRGLLVPHERVHAAGDERRDAHDVVGVRRRSGGVRGSRCRRGFARGLSRVGAADASEHRGLKSFRLGFEEPINVPGSLDADADEDEGGRGSVDSRSKMRQRSPD